MQQETIIRHDILVKENKGGFIVGSTDDDSDKLSEIFMYMDCDDSIVVGSETLVECRHSDTCTSIIVGLDDSGQNIVIRV